MQERDKNEQASSGFQFGNNWFILVLVVGVLILSSLAFIQPTPTKAVESTPSPTASAFAEEGEMPTPTETIEGEVGEASPTPEEIEYTNGIIFCSSVLILILLVGTLRETVRRKGR